MHRDVKGANVLIDPTGTVRLADFGASKKIECVATLGELLFSFGLAPFISGVKLIAIRTELRTTGYVASSLLPRP